MTSDTFCVRQHIAHWEFIMMTRVKQIGSLLPFSSFIGQNISFMLSSRFQLRYAWAMTNMYIHAFSPSKMIFKANLRSNLTIF